jgi:hypothetical protein
VSHEPFSIECTECQGCASGDGITSHEQAKRLGWTRIHKVNDFLSTHWGLCPEHSREVRQAAKHKEAK